MKWLDWKPQPKQAIFHTYCKSVDEVFYGGAAGPGKTDALMREVLRQIDNPNYRAILFRRTYPEVENTFIDMAYRWYKPAGLIPVNGGKVWKKAGGGSIRFSHLQYEKDVHKFQSAYYTVIGFDELTSFTEFQYDYMRSRNRTADITLRKYIISASNPGNVGHGWVRRRFVTPTVEVNGIKRIIPPNTIWTDNNGLTKIYVPARLEDNKILLEGDPGYTKRLAGLPAKLRKALLEGNWDIFEGQFFTEWSPDIHIIKPIKLDERWKVFISLDYGYHAPSSVHWYAIDFWGRIIVYKEIYETGCTYEQLGRRIAELNGQNRVDWIVLPKDLFKVSTESGIQAIEFFKKGLFSISNNEKIFKKCRLVECNDERVEGWTIMRDFIRPRPSPLGGITAGIVWTTDCPEAIRTIPELVHNSEKGNPEDVNSDGEDHCGDDTRYGLTSMQLPKSSTKIETAEQRNIAELNRKWRLDKKKDKLKKINDRRSWGV